MFEALHRYAPVTNLDELIAYSKKPLRKAKRVNTLKSTIKKIEQWAGEEGWKTAPVPWCAEGFTIEREDRAIPLGKDLLHILGHTYMQESASMLPVALLDPQPGDAILDMCSAPGSKTTQIAARMQGRGVLVANDVQEKRLWALISNLYRCGVTNTIIVRKVGQWFAKHMTERFDRILVDAPCTAQGTCRKDQTALQYCGDENIGKMARLQIQILESALHATKTGGRIVYSTCTLTWEENELVIAYILNKYSEQVSIVPVEEIMISDQRSDISDQANKTWMKKANDDSYRVQDFLAESGRWPLGTVRFPAFRLWPQTYDTEGFFACVLQKNAPTKAREPMERAKLREEIVHKKEVASITHALKERFGTSFMREDEVLLKRSPQLVVTTEAALRFALPVRPAMIGLPFGKETKQMARLSHEMASLRGHDAIKQRMIVSAAQHEDLFAGKNLSKVMADGESGDTLLFVSKNNRELCVGRGLLKEGDILNRLPREIVRMHT